MQIKAQLAEPTGQAWDRFVTNEGVTTAALLVAIAEAIADGWSPPKRIVERGRQISRANRSRR